MLKTVNSKDKNMSIAYLFSIIIIITNFSQFPYLVESGYGRYLSSSVWLIASGYIILAKLISRNRKIIINKHIVLLICLSIIFLSIVLIGEMINPGMYFFATLNYPFFLSMYILMIGVLISQKVSEKSIKCMIWAYIISTIVVALAIYLNFFSSGFNWNSRVYNYGSKNSISQIILTAVVFLVVVYRPKSTIKLMIKWFLIAILTLQILMLRSRATILGIPIMILIILFFDKTKSKIKYTILFISIIFLVLIVINDSFYNLIINNILFANRNPNDLNDLTSDRLALLKSFPLLFSKHPWIGGGISYRGNTAIESFPIAALIQYGVLGGIPLITIAFYPVAWSMRILSKQYSLNIAFISISVIYFFNGLFEALAPFGPGVKNYMLWFLFGLYIGRKISYEKIEW